MVEFSKRIVSLKLNKTRKGTQYRVPFLMNYNQMFGSPSPFSGSIS